MLIKQVVCEQEVLPSNNTQSHNDSTKQLI